MTREELIKKVGNEEQANYAMEILLGQVKWDMVKKSIEIELKKVENRLQELEAEDYIYIMNGFYHVNWNPNLDTKKQVEANALLYTRNRLASMTAIRI